MGLMVCCGLGRGSGFLPMRDGVTDIYICSAIKLGDHRETALVVKFGELRH